MTNPIRVLALAILQRDDGKLLLEKGQDTVKNEVFYRPMGGGVEFGEKGAAALIREFQEEIGKHISIKSFLGTVENIFNWQGQPGHQIILLYECKFIDSEDYSREHFPRVDGNLGHIYWRSVAEVRAESAMLYPQEVADLVFGNNKTALSG